MAILAAATLVLAGLVTPGGALAAASAPPIGAHEAELTAARADVAAAADRLVALTHRRSPSGAPAAADAFLAALKRAGAVVGLYRLEQVRDGTYAELSALQGIGNATIEGTAALADLAGVKARRPSRRARRQARGVDGELLAVAREALAERYRLNGLGTLLRRPSFKAALAQGVERVDEKLTAAVNRKLRRLTGLPVVLGVSLKTQLLWAGQDAVADWAGRLAVKAGPAGIVLSILSGGRLDPGRLVVLVGRQLKRALDNAFRGKGHLDARTARSLRSLDRAISRIQMLPGDAAFETLRRMLVRAQAAIGATHFLRGDVARRGRDDLAAQLDAKIALLQGLIDGYGDAVEAVRFHVGYRRLAGLIARALAKAQTYRSQLGAAGARGTWSWRGDLVTTTGGRCGAKPAAVVVLRAGSDGAYTLAVIGYVDWAFETTNSGKVQIFSIVPESGGDHIISSGDVDHDGRIQHATSGRVIGFTATGRLDAADAARIAAAGATGAGLQGRAGLNPINAAGYELEPDLSPCSAVGALSFEGAAAPQ